MRLLILASILTLAACTDADRASLGALGTAGVVTCYSGGTKVYEGHSTGIIQTQEHSDVWEFRERETGNYIQLSGGFCTVRHP